MEVVLTLTAHLEDVGDVLCGFDSVFPGADHVNGLRELRPEVRSELLGELRAQPGAELGLGHLPHTGVTLASHCKGVTSIEQLGSVD